MGWRCGVRNTVGRSELHRNQTWKSIAPSSVVLPKVVQLYLRFIWASDAFKHVCWEATKIRFSASNWDHYGHYEIPEEYNEARQHKNTTWTLSLCVLIQQTCSYPVCHLQNVLWIQLHKGILCSNQLGRPSWSIGCLGFFGMLPASKKQKLRINSMMNIFHGIYI